MNPAIALIIANIIWGAASPIFKFSLTNIPPFTLAFIRFFFAGLFFIPLITKKWQKMGRDDVINIWWGAFWGITINISFFFLGLRKTVSINAPIIASAGPVFLFFLSIIFLKEKPKLKVFLGMIVSLFGVLTIILSPIFLDNKVLELGEIEGNIFLIVATLGSVFGSLYNKKVLGKINAYQVTGAGFLLSSLTFLPFMMRELHSWSFSQLNLNGWIGIIFGVFFSSALAYYLLNYGLAKIQAQEIGIFTYIDPIVAILIAIPLLNEYPNTYFIIGSFFVFMGILLAEGRIHYHPFHHIKKYL